MHPFCCWQCTWAASHCMLAATEVDSPRMHIFKWKALRTNWSRSIVSCMHFLFLSGQPACEDPLVLQHCSACAVARVFWLQPGLPVPPVPTVAAVCCGDALECQLS